MRMRKDILILGGGISGLSLAWRLSQKGIGSQMIEAQSFVGGLAGTVWQGPYGIDFGPHSFFTEDREVLEAVRSLYPEGLGEHKRSVKMAYQGKLLDYPFTAANLLFSMGPWSMLQTVWSYLISGFNRAKKSQFNEDEETVEDWALRSCGPHLYRSFFKPYTEEFWQMACSELSARSIPSHTRTSFLNTLKTLIRKKFEGEGSMLEREKLPTYYPLKGYGDISERISSVLQKSGAEISLRSRVTQIQKSHSGWKVNVMSIEGEKEIEAPIVVSTLPLPNVVKLLGASLSQKTHDAAAHLIFRPFLFLAIVVKKEFVLNCGYMYTLGKPYNRLTDMNRFSRDLSPAHENILGLEIPCKLNDTLWNASKEEILEICLPYLEKDGILKREEVSGVLLVKAPQAYPIYQKGYRKYLEVVQHEMDQLRGFYSLGRGGEFMYMDADRCIRKAFDLGDRIAEMVAE